VRASYAHERLARYLRDGSAGADAELRPAPGW